MVHHLADLNHSRLGYVGPIMDANPDLTRRTVLAASAAGAGTLVLASCASSPGGTAPSESAGTKIAALADVPVGGSKSVKLADGTTVLVSRPTASTAACFSSVCTHQGCTVAASGKQFVCPCHGSIYNAFTGAVIQGAVSGQAPLPAVPVHVANGQIVTSSGA